MVCINTNDEEFDSFCQKLVQMMGDWYFELDINGKIIQSSESVKLFLGYKKNEILRKSIFDILSTSDSNLKNLIKKSVQKKEPILNFKVFLKNATDQKLKAFLNIIPWYQNDQKAIKFRGISNFVDSKGSVITLPKTKKNLSKQLVYNSLDEIVFHIDIKEKYKILNISKDNLIKLGYERAKLINISFLNLIYERDIYKFIDFIEKAIKKEKNFQIRLIDNKKKVFWFDIKEFEINTNTNHKILILKDISAEKVLIKKLNESEERLKLISDTIPEIRYWKLISPKAGKSVVAKSREMLETVIDTIPQYIFWKDASLKYLGCNKKFAQISGFGNHKSIIGKSDKDIPWLSSKSEEIRKIEKAIIASNKPQLNKIEDWKLPDGKRKWFEINRIPLYDPDNQPTGILSTFEDITDRKMAEEKLKESEQKYRGILENIKECYFEVDLKGNITFCNEAFLEQSEYSREEIIGLNFSKLVDDKNQKKIFLAFNKVYNSEVGLNDFKFKGFKKNGEEIVVETSVYLKYNSEGKKIGFSGILRIITEKFILEQKLKESEKKYRLISENAYDLISIVNENGIIEYINEKPHLQTVGFNRKDMLNHSFLEFIHPNDKKEAFKTIKESIDIGEGSLELRVKHKNKRWIWIEFKGREFQDVDGKKKAHLISREITERKIAEQKILESEEKLRQMNKELEEKVRDRTKELIKQNKKLKQLDKLKNDFISMAAHELKTPLISIGGYIDLILIREKENLNSEIKSDLHRAISNVKRLQQYINQLMDVMKIDAERMELDKKKVNLMNTIKSSVSELDLQIKEKDINLELSVPNHIKVCIDSFRIKQVLSNLLSNAIKFSKRGGKVIIDVKEEQNAYFISVKDYGIGLKESDLNKLFGKFVMVNKNIEKFSKGSGLGLYIAKGIIEAHGGKIEARSEGEKKGSEFIFSLPKR